MLYLIPLTFPHFLHFINLYLSSTRNIFIIPDDAVDRRKLGLLT